MERRSGAERGDAHGERGPRAREIAEACEELLGASRLASSASRAFAEPRRRYRFSGDLCPFRDPPALRLGGTHVVREWDIGGRGRASV